VLALTIWCFALQVLAQLGTEGVLVLEVPAGTPAAAAGLRATYRDVFGDIVLGDILVGMDTRPIRSTADLVAALDERRPGDKVGLGFCFLDCVVWGC
jgi:S1-C subfamily serine protease